MLRLVLPAPLPQLTIRTPSERGCERRQKPTTIGYSEPRGATPSLRYGHICTLVAIISTSTDSRRVYAPFPTFYPFRAPSASLPLHCLHVIIREACRGASEESPLALPPNYPSVASASSLGDVSCSHGLSLIPLISIFFNAFGSTRYISPPPSVPLSPFIAAALLLYFIHFVLSPPRDLTPDPSQRLGLFLPFLIPASSRSL